MNSIMEHAAKRLVYAGVIFILLTISAYSGEEAHHLYWQYAGCF